MVFSKSFLLATSAVTALFGSSNAQALTNSTNVIDVFDNMSEPRSLIRGTDRKLVGCGGGKRGDGTCAKGLCCSQVRNLVDRCTVGSCLKCQPPLTWIMLLPFVTGITKFGFCGTGPSFCGTCGGGKRGNGVCASGQCCSTFGNCGTGPAYCARAEPVSAAMVFVPAVNVALRTVIAEKVPLTAAVILARADVVSVATVFAPTVSVALRPAIADQALLSVEVRQLCCIGDLAVARSTTMSPARHVHEVHRTLTKDIRLVRHTTRAS